MTAELACNEPTEDGFRPAALPIMQARIEPRADLDVIYKSGVDDTGSLVRISREFGGSDVDQRTLHASGGALLLGAELAGSGEDTVSVWPFHKDSAVIDKPFAEALRARYPIMQADAAGGLTASADRIRHYFSLQPYSPVLREVVEMENPDDGNDQ
jgi:hypothetical protein